MTILEYHFNIGINIINNVNFDKIVNIFENIAPVIDKKSHFIYVLNTIQIIFINILKIMDVYKLI